VFPSKRSLAVDDGLGQGYDVAGENGLTGNAGNGRSPAVNLDLADIGALLVVIAPLGLLLALIFAIRDGAPFEDLVVPRTDFEWRDGVGEEEPVRWQVERLTPRDRRVPGPTSQPVAPDARPGIRRAPRQERSVRDRSGTAVS
jgi:hypothetical protein